MKLPERSVEAPGRWTSLWVTALLSLLAQLFLCQFFSFGQRVPVSIDVDPSNLWKYAYQFPPSGAFLVLNWLGIPNLPPAMNPFTLAALLPPWLFFTAYAPAMGTLALLAMAAFLRELEVPRPASLFGGIIFAWQGDILPFVFPGHFGYIGTWPFYALAAWSALRSQRTGFWAYALVGGASCGLMVGMQPDRGAIASLLIAALYLAGLWRHRATWWRGLSRLALCAGVALIIASSSFLALFQSFIVGVSMGGRPNREETYKFDTQFSYGPEETLTYLVPGFFGWNSSSATGPYWGRIGQWPDWPKDHQGTRNLNLAISATGTIATVLAALTTLLLLPEPLPRWVGPSGLTERQRFYGRVLLALGAIALVLAWGYHTPLYRLVFALPLMDKWRDPLKWLEMTNFALVVLSALGVQHLFGSLAAREEQEIARLRRRLRWFLDGACVLLLLGWILSYLFTLELAPIWLSEGYEPGAVASIMGTVHTSLFVAATLMFLVCVLLRLLCRPERLRLWKLENPWLARHWQAMLQPARLPLTLALGLALLSVAQLAWVATQFIRPVDLGYLTQTNALLEELKSEGNRVRVTVSAEDPVLNVLLQNQFNTPEISCLTISAASRIPDDLNAFFKNLDDDFGRLWFLTGVKNLVVPQAGFADVKRDPSLAGNIDHVDGYMLEPSASPDLPSHALVQFRNYMAKATFVPGAEFFPTAQAELPRIKDPKWKPRETVLLVGSGPRTSPTAEKETPAQLNLQTYDAHVIDLTVQAPRAGYILINDAYDPDWEVMLNGHQAPLVRADFMLRAIAIPAGTSSLDLRYIAHYRIAGLRLPAKATNEFCDLFMLGAWIVAGLALRRRKHTDDRLEMSNG